ncbi:MAG: right-handed parallel beta-helix repeat-containing protein, partial [Methanosarcinales archaeon]|nr:right-handed parallel beta-helix repeat-containing protein [Methanosarcinales archaeon]
MRTICTVCLIALLGAMMVAPAAATTWDVYEGDSIDSIRNTINNASDGDAVFFHEGTYMLTGGTGDWRLLLNTPNITVRGEGADVTILDGMGKSIIFIGALEASPGCVVEGFRIVNGSVGIGICTEESPNCIIRNNVFEDISAFAVSIAASNTMIVGNIMDGGERGIVVAAISVTNTTFMNNLVLNMTDTYCATRFDKNPNSLISNNTFINNIGPAIGLYRAETTNTIVTRNKVISNGGGIKLYNAPSGNEIYLNDFIDNTKNVVISGSGTPINIWNSTEPIEYTHDSAIHTNYLGNYWSDYSG